MVSQPTLGDVMDRLATIHGDVRVALDRTVTQERNITALSSEVTQHGKELAGVKSQATFFGTLSSAILVGLIEGSKSLFGGHSSG